MDNDKFTAAYLTVAYINKYSGFTSISEIISTFETLYSTVKNVDYCGSRYDDRESGHSQHF
jgi:hypothetical protein